MRKAGRVSDIRLFYHSLSEELTADTLGSLKFLLRGDYLTPARLEKIDNAKQLFTAIGEVVEDESEQLKLWSQLFECIGMRNLKAKIERFQQSRKGEVSNGDLREVNNYSVTSPSSRAGTISLQGQQSLGEPQHSLQQYSHLQEAGNTNYGMVGTTSLHGQQSLGGASINSPEPSLQHHSHFQETGNANYGRVGTTPLQGQQSLGGTSSNRPEPSLQHHSHLQETGNANYGRVETTSLQGQQSLGEPQHSLQQYGHLQEAGNANYGRVGTTSLQGQQSLGGTSSNRPEPSLQHHSLLQETGNANYGRVGTTSLQSQQSLGGASSNRPEPSLQHHDYSPDAANVFNRAGTSSEGTYPFAQNGDNKVEPQVAEYVENPSQTPWGHSSTDRQDAGSNLNRAVDGRDQPDRGLNPLIPSDAGSTRTTTNSTFVESQEKVPVENCIATDLNGAENKKKCPVEMRYECIKMYSGIGAKELGRGGFGVVYQGTRKYCGQDVVVKEEYSTNVGLTHSAKQLRREKRVGYVKHPHLMPLFAFSDEKGKPCCLMYPKMHSDLKRALLKNRNGQEKLSWEKRVRIALHTARALQYLHRGVKNERNIRQEIVHMDVKPGNIFLDEEFNARLGDAGMSQELPIDHSYASLSQMRGTEGYKDVYCQDLHLKPINDIFSFGVVMLELLTQRRAIERGKPLHLVLKKEGVLSDPEKLMTKAERNVWPDDDSDSSVTKDFASVAVDCLKPPAERDERAKLPDICKRLEAILERKGVDKIVKSKEGANRCVSCMLNPPAKYLTVRSSGCDGVRHQGCNYFCVTCLTQAQRNPLECPSHGPAEPLIGGTDIYAVLVCGNDPEKKVNAALFERDLFEFKNVLEDCRIIGIRRDHTFCIKPHSSDGVSQAAEVKQKLQKLKQDLEQQGKKDVFLYFYFTGHSDQNQNLICSSSQDVLKISDLKDQFDRLKGNVGEFLIILDCCFADGNIVSDEIGNEAFFVNKSPGQAEKTDPSQQRSVDFCKLLNGKEDCDVPDDPDSKETEICDQDTLDGNVLSKGPTKRVTVRQWSSSLREQSSYGNTKGNSFLTQYLVRGLRGAQSECPLANSNSCYWCETFKAQAKSVSYITAANLEEYISKHVDKHVQSLGATRSGERRQTPCMRSLHSSETVLAYYSEDVLRDEVFFKSPSGSIEIIEVDKFPLELLDFQKQLFSKVKGNLPQCVEPKHLQILCDGEEITTESYVDLMDFIRQGYDVRCQLRPHSSIVQGPVILEVQNSRDQVITLLESLRLPTREQDLTTFELDTDQKEYYAEDLNDIFRDKPRLSNFMETSLGTSVTGIISTASSRNGVLTIQVQSNSLDCSFKAAVKGARTFK